VLRVEGFMFRIQGSELRVRSSCSGFKVQGLGFRV
jgi:hypothetical protein